MFPVSTAKRFRIKQILIILVLLASELWAQLAHQAVCKGGDYLILVADEYESSPSLSTFVAFRRENFNVQVTACSNIGTSKDEFRNYVRGLMPAYVLLVGGCGDFPAHVVQYPRTVESYNYYVASSLVGHPHPDIPLGLFLVENEIELSHIVTKTIHAENNVISYPKKYYAHAGSRESVWPWPVEFNEEILSEMNDRYFGPEGFDFTLATALDDIPNDVWTDIAMINQGIKYMIYHGHGSISKWSFGLGVGGLPQLNNDVYPFIFSFSCSTGSFCSEVDGYSGDECFAQKIVACEHGAVAFFGAYNVSGRGMNPLLEGVVNGLFNETRLGDALIAGFNNTTNPDTVNKYYPLVTETERTRSAWQFHLFGDPAILINALTGDLNQDKRVDISDFCIMSEQWLCLEDNLSADIVDSGPGPMEPRVDIYDLELFVSHWLDY